MAEIIRLEGDIQNLQSQVEILTGRLDIAVKRIWALEKQAGNRPGDYAKGAFEDTEAVVLGRLRNAIHFYENRTGCSKDTAARRIKAMLKYEV